MKSRKNAVFAYEATTMFLPDDHFTFGREPTLRRMPDGSLISFIYTGGPCEPDPSNVAALIRSEDDGATWSKPQVPFQHPIRSTWGTEIFTDTPRPFCVFQSYDFATMFKDMNTFISYTDDSGRTWTPPENIRGVPANVVVRQCKKLSDGTLLAPVYWQEIHGDWDSVNRVARIATDKWLFASGVLRSTDHGKTFSLHGYHKVDGGLLWEPEAVELENGHILMFMRHGAFLKKTESFDGGCTWTPVVDSSIPNADTKFVIYKVRDRIVLINNICPNGKVQRSKLEMWVSDDLCRSWRLKLPLAELTSLPGPDAGWTTQYPYPQVAYPHGFADDEKELLYLAIDCITEFFLVKVPYADLLQ